MIDGLSCGRTIVVKSNYSMAFKGDFPHFDHHRQFQPSLHIRRLDSSLFDAVTRLITVQVRNEVWPITVDRCGHVAHRQLILFV